MYIVSGDVFLSKQSNIFCTFKMYFKFCGPHTKLLYCQMSNVVYSGHALSYTKLVHRHATQTEGNKYFK